MLVGMKAIVAAAKAEQTVGGENTLRDMGGGGDNPMGIHHGVHHPLRTWHSKGF